MPRLEVISDDGHAKERSTKMIKVTAFYQRTRYFITTCGHLIEKSGAFSALE
jgi:hypothetical protein